MATTWVSRTPSSSGSATTWTYSIWVKRGTLGTDQRLFSNGNQNSSGSIDTNISFNTSNGITFDVYTSGVTTGNIQTNRVFRDTSAFYHLLFVWNTTSATATMNGSATDRMQIWVNGVQETSLTGHTSSAPTIPSQNANDTGTNSTSYPMRIGTRATNQYFDGSMSHIHFTDGTAYDASAFGETDATTGEWKIKTSPSVTYGTNGFFILKDGNSVTDQSGEGNNFTVGGGTLTNTEDNPSNSFATINPLDNYYAGSSFANGNTYLNTSSSNYTFNNATLGYTKGKFYWEIKVTQNSGYDYLGITSQGSIGSTNYMYNSNYNYTLNQSGVLKYRAGGSTSDVSGWSGTSYTTDIIGIAHDCDNNKIYFHKNGTYMNSANPNTPTGGITTTAASATDTGVWLPAFGDEYASGASIYLVNFGNGYFGTTAITSEGTNASNIGKFEYDVPTGYTALCTKGLNE